MNMIVKYVERVNLPLVEIGFGAYSVEYYSTHRRRKKNCRVFAGQA